MKQTDYSHRQPPRYRYLYHTSQFDEYEETLSIVLIY